MKIQTFITNDWIYDSAVLYILLEANRTVNEQIVTVSHAG